MILPKAPPIVEEVRNVSAAILQSLRENKIRQDIGITALADALIRFCYEYGFNKSEVVELLDSFKKNAEATAHIWHLLAEEEPIFED